MIGIIAAVSQNGVIGINNSIPFYYPEDLKYFKSVTLNSTVIMGYNTFDSLDKKPLPNRRNIVITSKYIYGIEKFDNIQTYDSISSALSNTKSSKNVWFIGGSRIYQEAMQYADEINLTLTPDIVVGKNVVNFPFINPLIFTNYSITKFENNDKLHHSYYRRIESSK